MFCLEAKLAGKETAARQDFSKTSSFVLPKHGNGLLGADITSSAMAKAQQVYSF